MGRQGCGQTETASTSTAPAGAGRVEGGSVKQSLGVDAMELFKRLRRPANATEWAQWWGVSREEAVEKLERAARQGLLCRWERWVVRGHVLPVAYGPKEVRGWVVEKRRRKVLKWFRGKGPVRATYQEIADDCEMGSGDVHSIMKALVRDGRLLTRAPGVFEVPDDEGLEVRGSRTG